MSKHYFSKEDESSIVNAIKEAEKNTSGEIRVHVESHCKGEVMEHAKKVFEKLKMHQTAQRNGVLFYLAFKDQKFAILGDAGINDVVPHNFWEDIKNMMREKFKKGEFSSGLTEGIKLAGLQLKTHFPYHGDDKNELPDQITFGKE